MFRSWCSKNKFNNAKATSHVLMDGGVLSIPFNKLDEFCEQYVEAVKNKEKMYLVEQKTPTYNFFLDIDYKDEEALELERVEKICRVICDKVKTLGGRDCVVCVARPKKTDNNLIKTGVHLNWPGFVVNQEGALNIRDHVIATLTSVFKQVEWDKVVDRSVYKGSGFRIPWSYKKGKHIDCNGQGCAACEQTGKITESPYVPLFRYVYGPVMCIMKKISQDPSIDILRDTMVRTDVKDVVTIRQLDGQKKKEGSFSQSQMKDEFKDSEAVAHLETFIRKNMEGQEDARVTKIFTHKKQFLISTTSKYCENLGRSHNSNHVWFHMVGGSIAQKCFCDCETIIGRRHGFCMDFRGREHRLTDKIINKFYDDTPLPSRTSTPPPKQKIKTSEAVKVMNTYINNCIRPTNVLSVTKNRNKYTINVADTDCDMKHGAECHFTVDKSGIDFTCSKCTGKPRRYLLNKKSKEILFPDTK